MTTDATIQSVPKASCFGCGACVARCPTFCISMERDPEGFPYPVVSEATCIRCGQCRKVCPALEPLPPDGRTQTPDAFAVRHTEQGVRMSSTSGGLFTALAVKAQEEGCAVVGAAFADSFTQVSHSVAANRTQVDAQTGTKYVQSDTVNALRETRLLLNKGQRVFFTGTPCQVAGVRLLTHDAEGLVTADLVCQAVPSPGLFQRYTEWLVRRHSAHALTGFCFRDKRAEGWHRPAILATFDNDRVYQRFYEDDPFAVAFACGLAVRPCCHTCPFRAFPRPGDLTLGDFWGIERCRPELDDNTGTSLALIHTAKGAALFRSAAATFTAASVALAEGMANNPCLSRPVAKRPDNRDAFYLALQGETFERVVKRFLTPHRPFSLRAFARRLLKRS